MKFQFHRPGSIGFAAQTCIWGGLLVFVSGLYVALDRFLRISDLAEKAENIYDKNSEAFLAGYTPFYAEYMPAFPVAVAVSGLILFVAGLGMLKMRGWSRRLTIFYCIATIVLFLLDLVYQYAVMLPGLDAWYSEHRAGFISEARAPHAQFLIEAGLAASVLPFLMIALALLLWHTMRQPLFANTLVFAAPAVEKGKKEKKAQPAPAVAEPLPPIPPKSPKKRHRSRKDQTS